MYDFTNKFVLITGAAQGIGLAYTRELLRNGVQGITIVDINAEIGDKTTQELNEEFGKSKVIFVQTDITKAEEFEDAFKTSLEHWKALDIVINNAGMLQEEKWEMEISLNCTATLRGILLGFKYMSKRNYGRGGLIINTASKLAIDPLIAAPIYSATKSFVVTLGRSLGSRPYFDHNEVQVLTICPGPTNTELLSDIFSSVLVSLLPNNAAGQMVTENLTQCPSQSTASLAKVMITVIKEGSNGSVWIIEEGEAPYEISFQGQLAMRKIN